MRVLLTNDDGYKAVGARALAAACRQLGWEGTLIAPAQPMSGASRSRSSVECVWSEAEAIEGFDTVFLDATPAACVVFALTSGQFGSFDLCVSGVNAGENLGMGLTISGTFGAALEAACCGIRGVAVSRQYERFDTDPESWNWSWVPPATATILTELLAVSDVDWKVANVNLPNHTTGAGLVRAGISRASYFDDRFDLSAGRILSAIGYDANSLDQSDDIHVFAELHRPTVTLHDGRLS